MRRRVGQVIALSRLVLASVFLLAIFVDPSQPSAAPNETYVILGLYVVIAAVLLAVTWRNWWLDHRLARPAHWLDLAIFAVVVFSTEGYTSPFFTFSLFLLLSAAIRWGRRDMTLTAIAVNVLFLVAGLASALYSSGEIDSQRLLIRATYLAVLSLLFVWYSTRDEGAHRYALRTRLQGIGDPSRAIELIVEHVAGRLPSAGLLCVWQSQGGPVRASFRDEMGHVQLEGRQKELLAVLEEVPRAPFLFDATNRRLLISREDSATLADCPEVIARFLDRRDLTQGLAVPVFTGDLQCIVFAQAEVWVDDLATGAQLAEDAEFMHEQAVVNGLTREAATVRTRLSVARDLHDSVAQLLAGVSFRLEALKRSGKPAGELADELKTLQAELAIEQDQVRELIAKLRQPHDGAGIADMPARLDDLTKRLSRQWDVDCVFAHFGEFPHADTAGIGDEIQQMVREGVANAVRHGGARHVWIELRAEQEVYDLRINDDGTGLPSDNRGQGPVRPRSLSERALALGGMLEAGSNRTGTSIHIRLPAEMSA